MVKSPMKPSPIYTYLADCGIDCGMLLETGEDETGFSLGAFRGTPIDGASSDLYTYKGTAASTEEVMEEVAPEDTVASEDGNAENTEPADPDVAGATEDPFGAAAASEGDVTQMLANLQTDYNKINWGVSYSLDEQGNVLAKDMTYLGDEVAAGEKYAGSEDIYSDKELLSATKNMAVFAASTK